MSEYRWVSGSSAVDFDELSELYRIAPLGNKSPQALKTVFGNSMFACFAYHGDAPGGRRAGAVAKGLLSPPGWPSRRGGAGGGWSR